MKNIFMLRHLAILGIAASPIISLATPEQEPALPAKGKLHVYLLMGQSNMAGRDTKGLDHHAPDPRVLAMDGEGCWKIARDPLHPKAGRTEPGVGPGIAFAEAMLASEPDTVIGLVPCAVGGTALKRWVKGGDLYQTALDRAKLASKNGVLAGMLWHQGESDCSDSGNANSYGKRLADMIGDLRADLGAPDLPVVVGQLGRFLNLNPEKYPCASIVNSALSSIPASVAHSACVDAGGLGDKGDHLHFDSDSSRMLGVRYAKAMKQLANHPPTSGEPLWPQGRMPGHGARAPETQQAPERSDATRVTNVSIPNLTVFPAPARAEPAPAMIVCPGGGYSYVVTDKEGSAIAQWLNTLGITGIVLKYRVPNNRPGALQDIQRAISLARTNAARLHIDSDRIGVTGFSAGGHLAARSAILNGKRAYEPIDEADRASCRPSCAVLVYPAYLGDRQGGLSPDVKPGPDLPPILIVHNDDDTRFFQGSLLFDAALSDARSPHAFLRYPTGGHGYGLHCQRSAKPWPADAAKWLRANGMCPP